MLPIIRLGPAAIQTSILALIAAIWVGATIAEGEAKKRGLRGDDVWNLVSIGALTTLVAARVIYIAQNFSAYASDPLQIFSPAPGTLALGYGAIFGALAAYGYVQRRVLPLAPLLDSIAPGALAAVGIYALGQFLSGDAYGTPTNLPWGVFMWGETRHPVQLYDALGAFLGWGLIIKFGRLGSSALIGLVWYSAVRLIVDAYRGEAMILPNGFRVSQIIALMILLVGLWVLSKQGGRNEINQTQNNRERARE